MPIGWFGEDVADAAGAVVRDAWDLVDDLPGFAELGGATKALFKGPLRDFARTAVGQTVLRALTTGVMASVGYVAGPWAMMAAASLPGVAKGDSFDEALFSENLWRIKTAAEIAGPGVVEDLTSQYGQAVDEIKRRASEAFPSLSVPEAVQQFAAEQGIDLEAYARKVAADMGIREDMAAQALEIAARAKFVSQEDYDIATGRRVPGIARAVVASSPYARMSSRVATGPTPAERIAKLAAAPVQTRMRTLALREAEAPAPAAAVGLERSSGAQAPERPRSGLGADLALGALVLGAVGAVYLWNRAETRAGR